MEKILRESEKLIKKGKRATALDLLVHSLLSIRENDVLWLWHKDLFVYFEPKTNRFHAIHSKEISKLLRKLGYSEGITILHILGHSEASKVIKKIFSRGPYNWSWTRSLSYALKTRAPI